MSKRNPIFYSALLLTAVNLLLRFAGTSFQVYLSGKIGAEGIGLLQLVLSVGSMALVAGMAGIRTATMYLTAEKRGLNKTTHYTRVLSGSILYSILCSGGIALLLYYLAPMIAEKWIGNIRTLDSIRLYAAFLPVNCLCGVMVGFFTGVNRIKTLAAVEVAEQIFSIVSTLLILHFWAGNDPNKACLSVISGSGFGACLTLVCLTLLRIRDKAETGPRIRINKRLLETAIPLALADNLRTGISTVENLMVPKRLALYPGTVSPLGAFGLVCGMVFPILTFPMAILFGLTELLIPELARCNAAGSHGRISYLMKKCLRIALLFGTLCAGILYLCADGLCQSLYRNPDAATYLKWFAPLAIMLYCDSITDAMIKGLGEQKVSVCFNIFTNILDVVFLFVLLPKYGVVGYFTSFLITHIINFVLSLKHLLKITGEKISVHVPIIAVLCGLLSIVFCTLLKHSVARGILYPVMLLCMLYLCKIVNKQDILWITGLIKTTSKPVSKY